MGFRPTESIDKFLHVRISGVMTFIDEMFAGIFSGRD
jgi:hypothetical protein